MTVQVRQDQDMVGNSRSETQNQLGVLIDILVILPLMGHPQSHPYTHNTVDNKSTLLLIILILRPI